MAIQLTPENKFERFTSFLTQSDAKVYAYYLESLDTERKSEEWAEKMYRKLESIARGECDESFSRYFYMENDFHRNTNELFSSKLGIAPSSSEGSHEQFRIVFEDGSEIDLYRRSLVYEEDHVSPDAVEYQNYPFSE